MTDNDASNIAAFEEHLDQAQTENPEPYSQQAQAQEREQQHQALQVSNEEAPEGTQEAKCHSRQVEHSAQLASQQQQQTQAHTDTEGGGAAGPTDELGNHEFKVGEELVLFIARRQLESWDAPTQASVVRLSRATYAELLPRVSRAACKPTCRGVLPNHGVPAGAVCSFAGAVGLRELILDFAAADNETIDLAVEAQIALLAHLTGLQSLSMSGWVARRPGVLGVYLTLHLPASLAAVPRVSELHLSNVDISHLHHLACLSQLAFLDLRQCVVDLAELPALPSLRALHLIGNKPPTAGTLAALTRQTGLRVLHLVGFNDLMPYVEEQRVETLFEQELTLLTGLHDLSLHRCQLLTSLHPISPLTALTRLDVSLTSASSLQPLTALRHLQVLIASHTCVACMEPLAALTQLQTLDVSRTRVTSLQPLAALTQLKVLELNGLRGVSQDQVSALTGLRSLQRLGLRGTSVTDLSPLPPLTALRSLDSSAVMLSSSPSCGNLLCLLLGGGS